jgi:hypothetical protein
VGSKGDLRLSLEMLGINLSELSANREAGVWGLEAPGKSIDLAHGTSCKGATCGDFRQFAY